MTERLTQNLYKNYFIKRKKKGHKLAITFVIVSLLLVFVIIFVSIANSPSKNYKSKKFYIVYTGKYNNQSKAEEEATKVADLGGAGSIYNLGTTKFVVASIYFSSADADSVLGQIKQNFSDTGVQEFKSKSFSKSLSKQIEENIYAKEYYNNLYNFCEKMFDWSNCYDLGELATSDLYKNIMQNKQLFANIATNLSGDNANYAQKMYRSSLIMQEYIASFFSSAFATNNLSKYIKKLYVNSVIEFIDMTEQIG